MKTYNIALCVLFLFIVNHAAAQKNLVDNGDFEDDLTSWNGNGAKTTPWDFKSGKNSCAIITTDASNWVGIDQVISLPKKAQALEFSAWLKAENVVKGKDDWNGAVCIIEFLTKSEKKIGEDITIEKLTGDQPWEMVKKSMKTPENAASFKILLAMSYASGTMLIDGVNAKVINMEDLGK